MLSNLHVHTNKSGSVTVSGLLDLHMEDGGFTEVKATESSERIARREVERRAAQLIAMAG
jgi:hypothetical protein